MEWRRRGAVPGRNVPVGQAARKGITVGSRAAGERESFEWKRRGAAKLFDRKIRRKERKKIEDSTSS
jgi:hypothetical protein